MNSVSEMTSRLDEVAARFALVTSEMANPELAADAARYRKLAKEHAELAEVVALYKEWKDLCARHEEADELMRSSDDPEMRELAKEEFTETAQKAEETARELTLRLLPKDPDDDKNIILEIRAGTGGDEAALFAGEIFNMYRRYVEDRGWKLDICSMSPGTAGGYKEIISSIEGDEVYSCLKFESGIHRVQRVPATESQGRIHTSAITVAVMPEAEDVEVHIDEKDLRIDVCRSGGPGGQCVNTTDSAVRITHIPTGIVVMSQDEKSQHKNKAKGMKILRARLYDRMLAEQQAELSEQRRSMVRSGDRSEKIRTYNFPQDRVTDHRIGLTLHNLPKIMSGNIGEIITALRAFYQAEALKNQGR